MFPLGGHLVKILRLGVRFLYFESSAVSFPDTWRVSVAAPHITFSAALRPSNVCCSKKSRAFFALFFSQRGSCRRRISLFLMCLYFYVYVLIRVSGVFAGRRRWRCLDGTDGVLNPVERRPAQGAPCNSTFPSTSVTSSSCSSSTSSSSSTTSSSSISRTTSAHRMRIIPLLTTTFVLVAPFLFGVAGEYKKFHYYFRFCLENRFRKGWRQKKKFRKINLCNF